MEKEGFKSCSLISELMLCRTLRQLKRWEYMVGDDIEVKIDFVAAFSLICSSTT